jgi:DNA (cytosine-5)-methyltransferase 1
MPRLTAIDLFSGAGGLSLGLHDAGYDVLFASDWDAASARSYRRNFPETPFVQGDVRNLTGRSVLAKAKIAPGELDLLIGGPPCQGFSIIGSRVVHDERNDLFRDFLRIGKALKPRCMVIENVPGLATLARGAVLREILDGLLGAGYTATFAELLAAQYGVPQMRWRMVFVAFRKDTGVEAGMGFPKPTHGRRAIGELIPNCTIPAADMAGFLTVRETIGDLPPVGPGEEVTEYAGRPQCAYQEEMRRGLARELYNHYAPKLSPQNLARIAALEEGQDWRDLPRELLPEGMRRALRKDHTRRYSRMTWAGVARSIITRFRDPKSGEYTHPVQDRTISIREAARIQSFPDRFIFEGSHSEQYDQVGNAVPPRLAAAIAGEVRRCLEGRATHRLRNAFSRRPSIRQTSFAFDAV